MASAKLLLIIRAGRQSIHRSYSLISSRLIDILVSTYDASDWRGSDAKFFHTAPGGKFQGIAQLFAANPQLMEAYEYFWLFEDDLYLPYRSLEIMLSLLACGDISLAAPALTPDSFCNWAMCAQNERLLLRGTDFVEIMAPVMSRDFLKLCLPHFSCNYSGYGQEWMWRKILRETNRFAVIVDAAPIVHTRPHGKGSLAAHVPPGFVGFSQELRDFLAQHYLSAADRFRHLFGVTLHEPRRMVFAEDLINVMLAGYGALMRFDNLRGAACIFHLQKTNRPTMSPGEVQALSGFKTLSRSVL